MRDTFLLQGDANENFESRWLKDFIYSEYRKYVKETKMTDLHFLGSIKI